MGRPTFARLGADADLFPLHAADPARFPVFLESAAAHPSTARYDLLFVPAATEPVVGDPFARLDVLQRPPHRPEAGPELPFWGGWVLLLGYEALRWVEPSVPIHPPLPGPPEAILWHCPAALIRDRERGEVYAVAESRTEAEALLEALRAVPQPLPIPPCVEGLVAETPERYRQGVRRIHDYLRAGDVFQVNLSREWRGALRPGTDPAQVYAALRRHNPAPFAASLRGADWAVLSSSPERLLALDGRELETRPIAGTRRRDSDPKADAVLKAALLESRKERAEHIMLIDLERNDLGRVCEPGSVRVAELMALESYAHVHHLVSSVRGRLRPGVGPGSALKAVFPGGTITGCPKVRCMAIIHELESGARGPYTGAVVYGSRCGRLDSNILIRTVTVAGDQLRFRVGAGIVADSDPEAELAETEAKARGLLLALGAA